MGRSAGSGWNLAFVPSNKKCSWRKGTYVVTADPPCQSALQLSCEDLQQLNVYAIWMFPSLAPLTRDEPNGLVEAGDQRGLRRSLPRNICGIRTHKRCRMSSSDELWINTPETDRHTVVEEEEEQRRRRLVASLSGRNGNNCIYIEMGAY